MPAQFGPLKELVVTDLELVAGIPVGGLITPQETDDVSGVTAILASRFPTPPSAFGFLYDLDPFLDIQFDGVTKVITGAVYPESLYLEPTTGQIWPR